MWGLSLENVPQQIMIIFFPLTIDVRYLLKAFYTLCVSSWFNFAEKVVKSGENFLRQQILFTT